MLLIDSDHDGTGSDHWPDPDPDPDAVEGVEVDCVDENPAELVSVPCGAVILLVR